MDFIKFIEERNRMCDSYAGGCDVCPMYKKPCLAFRGVDVERLVSVVEEWSAAHPRKTRQSVFLEQYPGAKIDSNTCVPIVYPCQIEQSMENVTHCNSLSCSDCRREFWMEEVE